MPEETVVIDTSALIALEKIDLLHILGRLYEKILVPDSVLEEFGNVSSPAIFIEKVQSKLLNFFMENANLGKGESAAILLAYQGGYKIIIDDLKARKIANKMGLQVTGTIGVLLKAQKTGLIQSAYEYASKLQNMGFYIDNALLNAIGKYES